MRTIDVGSKLITKTRTLTVQEIIAQVSPATGRWETYVACESDAKTDVLRLSELIPLLDNGTIEIERQ